MGGWKCVYVYVYVSVSTSVCDGVGGEGGKEQRR